MVHQRISWQPIAAWTGAPFGIFKERSELRLVVERLGKAMLLQVRMPSNPSSP